MRIFAVFLALLVATCLPLVPKAKAADGIATTAEACAARGGNWRRVCMKGEWTCVMTYKDAGKSCTDGDQCESKQCRYFGAEAPKHGMEAKGRCWRDTDPCGCRTLIKDGKIDMRICLD